ncbi:MAG: ATP-dependent RecD-like DNA helicase [Erysipelotrichaceae bacterium]
MELIQITGHFIYEKYRSENYAVYLFQLYDKSEKKITVKGNIPLIEDEDLLYECSGNYVEHPKYGMQFDVQYVKIVLPSEEESIVKYLKSSHFSGIGEKTAQQIVDALGVDCLNVIKENKEVLYQLSFLNNKKIQAIIEGIEQYDTSLEESMAFFTRLGLTYRQIMKIDVIYKENAIKQLSENPYALVYDVAGIGYKIAHKLASQMKFEDCFHYREEAFLVSLVLSSCVSSGDTYVEYDSLYQLYSKSEDQQYFNDVLKQACLNHYLIQDEDKIYHQTQYQAEVGIARYLNEFPNESLPLIEQVEIEKNIDDLQQKHAIQYDELQKDAMFSFMNEHLMILTGGPGTGKTTVVKALIELFKYFYPNHVLACIAPTGRASKRLKELCECDAYTIHSLLTYDLESNTFGKNIDNPIVYDALIIDEASMIDNWLFYNLLLASQNVKKICIIGDEDQLPSVGPGQLLKDLIDSQQFRCIALNTIHRQKQGSDIVELSKQIRNGIATFDEDYQEAKFYETQSMNDTHLICNIVEHALNKEYSLQDIQVLSSMYRGSSGIDNLNHALQNKFNPHNPYKNEIKVGFITFREEDKILQLKNQAEDDVYNGDIGILKEIVLPQDAEDKQAHLFVDFDGIFVEYTSTTIQNITHAYCVSVHKAQGSEYPIVILAIPDEARFMLKRKLLYTAITRAKKSLILVGSKNAYYTACETLDRYRRTSLVTRLLKGLAF